MTKDFYRFRSVEKLIGEKYQELERQVIYFAEPSSLNDPIEGFRDYFWDGDEIIWKNLFKHYLFCLERSYSLLWISGEEHPLSEEDIPVLTDFTFPTPEYEKLFNEVSESFFSKEIIIKLINVISKRNSAVRRNELFFYIRVVHFLAIDIIHGCYQRVGLIPQDNVTPDIDYEKPIKEIIDSDFVQNIEKNVKSEDIDTLFAAQKHTMGQIDIINYLTNKTSTKTKNKNLVFLDFPNEYIQQLEKLVFPNWYTACFMSECRNSSVWGSYGDNHTGVCLIFNSEEKNGKYFIKLKSKVGHGMSGAVYDNMPHELNAIDYVKGYGEVDFFRKLGRLPIPTLNKVWYSFKGEMSSCAKEMNESISSWRENYWKEFYRDITVKSKDWEYENEYRIIISDMFSDHSKLADRLLPYDFDSLKGIIFGIKTKLEDKIKILKVIENKCVELGREDFKFYQAFYDKNRKDISFSELSLLKIKA
ncbi:TPA: DUF2971 domain-containing protein [Kluyvera ascorbata]